MSKVMSNVLKVGATAVAIIATGLYGKHMHDVEKEKKNLIKMNKDEIDELICSARKATNDSIVFSENFDKVFSELKRKYKRTHSIQSAQLALWEEKDVLKTIAELSENSQAALKYYLENQLLQKEISELNKELLDVRIEKAIISIAYTILKNQ